MRKDTRFSRPNREELDKRVPSSILNNHEARVVWNMMLQSDDPSEVCRWFRSYRDSPHCSVPKLSLKTMRDTIIEAMREENKRDASPRVEKKKRVHYPDYFNTWHVPDRKSP